MNFTLSQMTNLKYDLMYQIEGQVSKPMNHIISGYGDIHFYAFVMRIIQKELALEYHRQCINIHIYT